MLKVTGAALLFDLPAMLLMCFFGKPLIHILFQHGAFTRRSTNLTTLALTGYPLELPGTIVAGLLTSTFYAMKDALTPLFTVIANVAVHVALLFLLFHTLSGTNAILSVPLSTSSSFTAQALLLGPVLYPRFRKKIAGEKQTASKS